jgi:hypothetical protein
MAPQQPNDQYSQPLANVSGSDSASNAFQQQQQQQQQQQPHLESFSQQYQGPPTPSVTNADMNNNPTRNGATATLPTPTPTLFPAGLSGTSEFGAQWPSLECEAHAVLNRQVSSSSVVLIDALVRMANAQLVETLEPNADRPFTEAILAVRSATDGGLCLIHCRLETDMVATTCRSANIALANSVAALCGSIQ